MPLRYRYTRVAPPRICTATHLPRICTATHLHCHASAPPDLLTPRGSSTASAAGAGVGAGEASNVPLALKRYNKNRVLRAAAVQGMSRLSSAILFQYNHPTELEMDGWVPRLRNTAPKSVITRAGQGFLQHVAFPLQFEFLFDFLGGLGGGALSSRTKSRRLDSASPLCTNATRRSVASTLLRCSAPRCLARSAMIFDLPCRACGPCLALPSHLPHPPCPHPPCPHPRLANALPSRRPGW